MPDGPVSADGARTGATPVVDRRLLVGAITTFLGNQDAETLTTVRAAVERTIDEAGRAALDQLNVAMANAGADWAYYPPDPLARHIHHVLADHLLHSQSALSGLEHLAASGDRPLMIFANHLSYADANLVEILFYRLGAAAFADRLTVTAGPKVYSSLKRRFSSLCFGTVKTPQNSGVSSEDAVMNAREVVRAARQSIRASLDRVARGEVLLVFPEGTRSRTKGMQPLLAGIARYLEDPGVLILPMGITGTEMLFPVGDEALHSYPIVVRVGAPFSIADLRHAAGGDRHLMMDIVGVRIAQNLPAEYQGAYAPAAPGLERARELGARL